MSRIGRLIAALALLSGATALPAAQDASPSPTPGDFDVGFAKAVSLHQAGDLLGALVLYEDLLVLAPKNPDVRSNYGAALSRLGRFEQAIEQYRLALASDEANTTYRFNLALALYKAARVDEAAVEFERILAREPDQKSAVLLLADCWLQAGTPRKVVELLDPRRAAFADDRAYEYLLGSALIDANDLTRGNDLIERLMREGSAEAYMLKAASQLKPLIGNDLADPAEWEAATESARRARHLNPRLLGVNFLYGRCLLGSRDWDGAARAFRDELEINPNHFESNLLLGNLRRDEGRYDEALVYLKRATQMRSRDSRAMYSLATVYQATDKLEEARALLEDVARLVPDSLQAHVTLATVLTRLKRSADAERERAIIRTLGTRANADTIATDPVLSSTSREEKSPR